MCCSCTAAQGADGHSPWRCSRVMEMWHSGYGNGGVSWGWTWGSGRTFPTLMILWFSDALLSQLPRMWVKTPSAKRLYLSNELLFNPKLTLCVVSFSWDKPYPKKRVWWDVRHRWWALEVTDDTTELSPNEVFHTDRSSMSAWWMQPHPQKSCTAAQRWAQRDHWAVAGFSSNQQGYMTVLFFVLVINPLGRRQGVPCRPLEGFEELSLFDISETFRQNR